MAKKNEKEKVRERNRPMTCALKKTLAPFSIPVLDIYMGEENITFDGPLEYSPIEVEES